MSRDPVRDMVLHDLRLVRRGAGDLTQARLAHAYALIEYLGRGSSEQAYTALVDVGRRLGHDPGSDVAAYFFTCGQTIGGETLDWRLKRYADEHYVDARTALRRSDRGAEKLAQVIRDSFENERPWGILVVKQEDDTVRGAITLCLPVGSERIQPQIYVGDELLQGMSFDFEEEGVNPLLVSCTRDIPRFPLRRDEDPAAEITVYWRLPVWPTWMVGAHVLDPGLHAKMEVNAGGSVVVGVESMSEVNV